MARQPSGLVSGKFFRLSVFGEIPAQMAGLSEQEIAQSFIAGFSISLATTGYVQGLNFEVLSVMPELPTDGN